MWTDSVWTWASWMAPRGANGATRAWELDKDQTVRLTPGRGGVVLRAERGCLLVTQEGDPEDHVLGPGDELRMSGRGLAVAWALSPSSLAVADGASSAGMARASEDDYSPGRTAMVSARASVVRPTR